MADTVLRYTETGFLVILPGDNPRLIIDAMLETGYSEEFCVSPYFDPGFIAGLMEAGFLVMSVGASPPAEGGEEGLLQYILLPKLHLKRSVLFFDRLHIKKTIKRYLNRYELRYDSDFDRILDRCLAIHGEDWLTPPLVAAIRHIRRAGFRGARPVSFGLYRDGKLAAGEFGVIAGNVYTSYSGYRDESNSGTVQLILTAQYLREHGFAFFDLGMPLDYKTLLGAEDLEPGDFVRFFRSGQDRSEQDAVQKPQIQL